MFIDGALTGKAGGIKQQSMTMLVGAHTLQFANASAAAATEAACFAQQPTTILSVTMLYRTHMQGTGATAELETSYQCSYLTLHRCRTPYQLHSPITKSDHKEANMTSLVPGAGLLV